MESPGVPDDFVGAAAYYFEKNRPLLLMELHLLVSALFPIYAGAHASLSRPISAAKPEKRKHDLEDDEEEEEDRVQNMEGLTARDAVIFPITAGIVLAGLYFAIKAYGADMINLVLGVYFSLIGTYSVAKLINDSWAFVQSFITPSYYRDDGKLWKAAGSERRVVAVSGGTETVARASPLAGFLGRVPLPAMLRSALWNMRNLVKRKYIVKAYWKDQSDFKTTLTQHNVLSSLAGIAAVSYSMFVGKPWWLTNLQGFAVCYGALQLMSPTTFATGTLVLSGLFFYDIWAVFFTPLMVTVAKNLDVPIKLVFPRPEEPSQKPGEPPVKSYSMLGLGDIVLPGLMIALALRFDLYMFYLRKQKKTAEPTGTENGIEKAPYVTVSGHWGESFWTSSRSKSVSTKDLPAHLRGSFPKPYFHATLVGYVFGMLLTLGFMTVFQHAQPALLYLVPTVLVSLWGTGLARAELKHMWDFTEAITGEAIGDGEDKELVNNQDDLESDSIFSTLWNAITGKEEHKKAETPATSQKNKTGAETSSDETDKERKNDETKSEGGAKDAIFRLEISRPSAKSGSDAKTEQKAAETTKGVGKQPDSNDSISDDTVVVSQADLEGAKNAIKDGASAQGLHKRARVV